MVIAATRRMIVATSGIRHVAFKAPVTRLSRNFSFSCDATGSGGVSRMFIVGSFLCFTRQNFVFATWQQALFWGVLRLHLGVVNLGPLYPQDGSISSLRPRSCD